MAHKNFEVELKSKFGELLNKEGIIRRFYHIKSIENFVAHFGELHSESDKKKVFSILNEYLILVVAQPINNIKECNELFDHYIAPVGILYERDLNFWPKISLWVIALFCLVIFCILFILHARILFFWSIGVVLCAYYIYTLKKRGEKRSYGFKY